MKSWQLSPRHLKPCTILLQREDVAYQIGPLSSATFSSFQMFVLCLSSRDVSMSHSMSWSWVVWSSRRSILLEFFLSSPVMLVGVLKARHRDKDGDRVNVPMQCNLDHEDRVSCAPLSSYLTSWISGRDSCLVGVSCHSPSSVLVILFDPHVASCLNSKEFKMGMTNPSTRTKSNRVNHKYFQWTQNAPEKISSFLNWLTTSTENGARFSRSLWIFEVIQHIFELEKFK